MLDGSVIDGGAINGNPMQIAYVPHLPCSHRALFVSVRKSCRRIRLTSYSIQLAGGFGGFFYSFFATVALLAIIQFLSIYFPSLELRARSRRSALVALDEEELEDTGAVSPPRSKPQPYETRADTSTVPPNMPLPPHCRAVSAQHSHGPPHSIPRPPPPQPLRHLGRTPHP